MTDLLDQIAATLRGADGLLQIQGHADHSGEARHNQDLGRDRAHEVAVALVDRGTRGGNRMRISTRGETQPVSLDAAGGYNALNRRVELWLEPVPAGSAAPECDIYYSGIPLIPQPNKLSCWAAAGAMMVSYHERRTVRPEEIARRFGVTLEESNGSIMSQFEDTLGMEPVVFPEASVLTTVAQWCDWLHTHGPLLVSVVGDPGHSIVVHGLVGSGDGAQVYIHNPWDTSTRFDDSDPHDFHPANRGLSYHASFGDFRGDFGGLGLANFARLRVLHW